MTSISQRKGSAPDKLQQINNLRLQIDALLIPQIKSYNLAQEKEVAQQRQVENYFQYDSKVKQQLGLFSRKLEAQVAVRKETGERVIRGLEGMFSRHYALDHSIDKGQVSQMNNRLIEMKSQGDLWRQDIQERKEQWTDSQLHLKTRVEESMRVAEELSLVHQEIQ